MADRNIHLDAALEALRLGFSPLPPRQDGTKAPLADIPTGDSDHPWTWEPYQTIPATEEHIRDWYHRRARTGNGLATGYGGSECLEFDDAGTYDEYKRAANGVGLGGLVERVDSAYCEVSPGGGYHWLYRCDELRGNTKLAERPVPGEPFKREVLIETRGAGGFIIIAPSCGKVHPSGQAYRLLRGRLATVATVTAAERNALWELARTFDEMPEPDPSNGSRAQGNGSGRPGASCHDAHDARPGDAFEAQNTWEDILEPMGWIRVFTRGSVSYWRRPGKNDGVSATTGHCKGLYVFTTSTLFRANESYSKFGVYALVHHGGDYGAAAKELARQGYGASTPVPQSGKNKGNAAAPPDNVAAAGPEPDDATLNLTEWGNARRLVAAYGRDVRFCKPLGQWYCWDGRRWCPDQDGAIWRYAKDTVRRLGQEAADAPDDRRRKAILSWALKSEERRILSATIELAWSERGIGLMPDQFDRNPWLLNCPNGTVDLKTGRLRPHDAAELITKMTSVPCGEAADCPKWLEALGVIFGGKDDLIGYMQRALGYSLTGIVAEHALFLCYGTGRNGKNTILDSVRTILDDYATVADPRTFLSSGRGEHPAMLADLLGRRYVPTSEVEEGEKLAEGLVKRVTGDRTLKARFMRQNPFEFPILFKLWLLANAKPEIHGQDEGIWSRIRIIPFDVFIPPERRIKNFSEILVRDEGPGILRWLIDGCLEWRRIGLAEPPCVINAIKGYRFEEDPIGDFLGQECEVYLDNPVLIDSSREKCGDIYRRYVKWCKANGEKTILTNRKFGSEMTRRGFAFKESNGSRYRAGLKLKQAAEKSSGESDDEEHGERVF